MAYTTTDIRNVCLVGPGQAGKTQLTEALLFHGGAIPKYGCVEQGDTVSDFNASEREIGHFCPTELERDRVARKRPRAPGGLLRSRYCR